MITNINEFRKINEMNAAYSEDALERFLSKFPDDTKTWSKATAEPPDMYMWICSNNQELLPVGRDNCKTPSEWNTKYKAAIRSGIATLDEEDRNLFAVRFGEWLNK